MDELLSQGLLGQGKALDTLYHFYRSDRIPHALLFSGPEGVGKHLAAKNFLKLLNSNLSSEKITKIYSQIDSFEEPAVKFVLPLPRGKGETNTDSPVGKLTKTQIEEIASQIHKKAQDPYFRISIPNANTIKINSIRDINKFISLYGNSEEYKAIIISNAHLMNVESQNALLKNLEEPPPKIIFILITDQPNRLLETIRSRSWVVNFLPLGEELVERILEKNYNLEPFEARNLAVLSGGSVTKALQLRELNLEENIDSVITILRYSLGRRYATALKEFNKSVSNDSEPFLLLLSLILYWFADTVSHKNFGRIKYFAKHSETIQKFNQRFSGTNISEIIDTINNYILLRDKNISLNVLIMNVIFELAKISI